MHSGTRVSTQSTPVSTLRSMRFQTAHAQRNPCEYSEYPCEYSEYPVAHVLLVRRRRRPRSTSRRCGQETSWALAAVRCGRLLLPAVAAGAVKARQALGSLNRVPRSMGRLPHTLRLLGGSSQDGCG